jgi:PAT family beta-lactamase induction signal transducer AmpG
VKESIKSAILNRRMLICVFTGFSSGLPLYILIQLIPAWLRTEGVNLKTIGFFALIGIPYTCKFLWAPLMDGYVPPFLGRRRSWMLITQILLFISIIAIGYLHPEISVMSIAWMATAIAFFGASQDVVLDAYRRELLPDLELGLGNSVHVQAFRLSSLIPGSLALIIQPFMAWHDVFIVVALFMIVGMILTFCISETPVKYIPPRSFRSAVVDPYQDFFSRFGLVAALQILLFMFFYKLGDSMATALATPFYIDLGFTLPEIGSNAKIAGLGASIIGGLIGGILMIKTGINRALWLFGILQWVAILGFVVIAEVGHNNIALFVVVAAESFGMGMGAAALTAFIARVTNPVFAATQFALLTALMAVPRTFANAVTGILVEHMGWTNFFLLCMLLAVPGMLLLLKVAPWDEESPSLN